MGLCCALCASIHDDEETKLPGGEQRSRSRAMGSSLKVSKPEFSEISEKARKFQSQNLGSILLSVSPVPSLDHIYLSVGLLEELSSLSVLSTWRSLVGKGRTEKEPLQKTISSHMQRGILIWRSGHSLERFAPILHDATAEQRGRVEHRAAAGVGQEDGMWRGSPSSVWGQGISSVEAVSSDSAQGRQKFNASHCILRGS